MAIPRTWLVNNRLPFVLVAIHLTLAVGYSNFIPIFEASDENNHFFFARFLAQTGRIPDVRFEEGPWGQQATQGPLFYLTAAIPIALIDTRNAEELVDQFNPFVNLGDGSRPGNKNAYLHDPRREAWPWQNAILAVHVGRWVSALYGAMTVWFVYWLVYGLVPRAAGAAGLMVAVLPQFVWESGALTNDVAIAATAALALWVWVESTRPWSTRRLILLGAALGLATLSKTPGLILSGYIIGLLALETIRSGWRTVLKCIGGVTLAAGVIAGPWLAMNWLRYDDPTGLSAHLSVMGGTEVTFLNAEKLQNLFPPELVRASPGYVVAAFTSLWGVFGLHNILAPAEVYAGFHWLALLGFAGFGLSLIWPVKSMRRGARPWFGAMLGWLGLHLITLVYWAHRSGGGPGRLLFPSLPVIALACAVGWLRWADWIGVKPLAQSLRGCLPGLLGMFAITAPAWLILPAYSLPPAITELPPTATPLHIFYADLELVGIETRPVIKENERFSVTFYWRLARPTTQAYAVFPKLLDHQLTPVAGTNTYPGWGNWPTRFWEPGRIYVDRYQLPVAADAARPGLGRTILSVEVDGVPQASLGQDGQTLDPAAALAWVGFAPKALTAEGYSPIATFGDAAILLKANYPGSIARGEPLHVTLIWQARQSASEMWKRFVHLDDGNRLQPKLFAQKDDVPANGFGLPWWEAGMVIPDEVSLSLESTVRPGQYALWVGLVDAAGQRVSITGGDHQAGRLYLGLVVIR